MYNMYMRRSPHSRPTAGFTLIEMIVSLGIFAVVITMAVGSLLVLVVSNERIQGEQSVMTNLAFALDSMTREVRTGYNYYCDSKENYNAGGNNNIFNDANDHEEDPTTNGIEGIVAGDTDDCSGPQGNNNLHGVSFYEGGKSILGVGTSENRILYFYDSSAKTIKRRVGNGPAQPIISSGIEIVDVKFIVTGSEPQSVAGTDFRQPTVTIYIEAKEVGDDTVYKLQTTVTQRILDL